ncbi:nucleotidyltransferase substrate binding protein [Pontiella sulfatireligans]|uniref:Nucleotidyltransferase n=1 Tax=Pontiella sulfatireligans TaxID=2750658 RepID=A0A6C2UEC3_9BACT|nr:nucleotidyltransferase substrate binding protein [Pontiella sulfatireligans]VGO18505.1 hypothetical protein SCARR_00558 [Pontiella sulfatireligans]
MGDQDIRWIQRFSNYSKALAQLEAAVALSQERALSDLEKQGVIKAFEYTHEMAWKTLKDFLEHKGNKDIYGSKDATRKAFSFDLIEDGGVWMKMIEHRNETVHTYTEAVLDEIYTAVVDFYFEEFMKLKVRLAKQMEE